MGWIPDLGEKNLSGESFSLKPQEMVGGGGLEDRSNGKKPGASGCLEGTSSR